MIRRKCLLAWSSTLAISGCALNPATGGRQLSLISEAQEVQLGREAAKQVEQTIGFVPKPDLQAYVGRIGRALAASSERPNLPWEFHVVDDPVPNAFALPGGFVYVTRGLINLLTSEAQLASVLSHEVAHITARHAVNQISRQQLTQLGLGLGGIFFPAVQEASPFLGAGLSLMFLKYGRDDEREADSLGFGYVNHIGYVVSEFDDVFSALQRAGDQEGALPGWLSTHPGSAERIEDARAMAAKVPDAQRRLGRDVFIRQIDGLVYGPNPRHGFFRQNVFYHPELRFQLTFPPGWQTQHLAQAVVGVARKAPAAVELTIAPAASAQAALTRFADQAGVNVGRTGGEAFGTLRGMRAEFRARTSAASVRGFVAFAEHGGRVYQIVAYSTNAYFGAAAPTLSTAIESFRPVTDAEILGTTPNRIDVVQLQQDQTLAGFAERFPSTVPIEQLALINHLPDVSARITAGTLVKRVIS